MKRKSPKIHVHVWKNLYTSCKVCDQKLSPKTLPETDTEGMFCERCHIYYSDDTQILTKNNMFCKVSEKGIQSFRKTYLMVSQSEGTKFYRMEESEESRNIGKEGFCIKCGNPVYNNEPYCFQCFKNQKEA